MRGFICGAWDLLHPGHLFTLRACKRFCNHLIIGLHIDPSLERKDKNKPLETAYDRFCRLQACKYVDEIIPYETEKDLENLLITQNLDIRFLSEEYKEIEATGQDLVPIKYIRRDHSYSSSELRERIKKS